MDIKKLKDQGVIIILVSKNIKKDVFKVFKEHRSMILKQKDIGAYKIETLPDGQTRGIEVDLMSSVNNKKFHSRPTYESITREDIETSLT